MEPDNSSGVASAEEQKDASVTQQSLRERFTTVTPLSKYLAMALFVLLPFVGFYLGLCYQGTGITTDHSDTDSASGISNQPISAVPNTGGAVIPGSQMPGPGADDDSNPMPTSPYIKPSPVPVQPPSAQGMSCGITSCHGYDITCGDTTNLACTMEYRLGDGCRQFASCEVRANSCTPVLSERFNTCKSCVETCKQKYSNSPDVFTCESACYE